MQILGIQLAPLAGWTAGFAVLLGLTAGGLPGAEASAQEARLAVGDRAPAFPSPLASTAGESPGATKLSLEDVLGKKNIVLAFYVADWSGG